MLKVQLITKCLYNYNSLYFEFVDDRNMRCPKFEGRDDNNIRSRSYLSCKTNKYLNDRERYRQDKKKNPKIIVPRGSEKEIAP